MWLWAALTIAPPSLFAQELATDPAPDAPPQVAPTPGAHRLFFVPTGRTLPAGTAEGGAYQLLAP